MPSAPAPSSTSSTDLGTFEGWWTDPGLLPAVRELFTYEPGSDRATGYLYSAADGQDWPLKLADHGPTLLDDLEHLTGVRYTVCAFQAYLNGSGCDWHADTPFDAQAILSLGETRTFGVRPVTGEPAWMTVKHGDLVLMPPGYQVGHEHCVPVEDVPGERVSLVFRTVARS